MSKGPTSLLIAASVILTLALSWSAYTESLEIRRLRSASEKAELESASLGKQLSTLKKSLEGLPDAEGRTTSFKPRSHLRVDVTRAQWRFSGVTQDKGNVRYAQFLWQVEFLNRDSFNRSIRVDVDFLDGSGFKVADASGSGTVFAKEGAASQRVSAIRGNVLIPLRLATSVRTVEVRWVTY